MLASSSARSRHDGEPSRPRTTPGSVVAPLNYLGAEVGTPVYYLYRRPGERDHRVPRFARHEVEIRDARDATPRFSWQRNGFSMVPNTRGLPWSFGSSDEVEAYLRTVEAIVKSQTGARRVVAFDHNIRAAREDERSVHDGNSPVKFIHNDYTDASAPRRVRELMGEEASRLLQSRFVMMNVWRPLRRTVEESPLAVCDAETIEPGDLVPSELRRSDRSGEIFSMRFSPRHRWAYFPRMAPDELLLLRCFDSALSRRAALSAHTSFDDPLSRADAPLRESIEVRTAVFF